MDLIVTLILAIVILSAIVCLFVLPIVALVFSFKTRSKIARLEAQLLRLEATLENQTDKSTAPEPQPAPKPIVEPEPARVEPEPPPAAAEPIPIKTGFSIDADQIESIIGRRWLGWAAVILILFATAFFLKYAFDNRWIGELGRVSTGIALGIGMTIAGYRYHRRGWRIFSQILTAGGIVLLYLSTYAAFGYYHLVGQKTAFIYIAVMIAEAAALSLVYNSPAIAIMALIGGLLTPVLLHSDRNQYRSFFAYLVILDAGTLALLKHWRGLTSIAYFGTQVLFWLWYDNNYHHQLRGPVLLFHTAIFLLFLLAHLARDLFRRNLPTTEDAILLLVNPFVFFATCYELLNGTHHDWMGVFAIGMALVHAGAAKLLLTRGTKSRREILLLIAIALTFITIAIPIQLRSNWITIAWAAEALAILWAGLEIRSIRLRAQAFVLFGLAFVRFLIWDTSYGYRPTFIPVFNAYFLSSLVVIGCFLGAAYLYQRASNRKLIDESETRLVFTLAAAFAFWVLISIETYSFFVTRSSLERSVENIDHQLWLGQMTLSVVWAAYAASLAAVGFVRRIGPVRWAALVLFALTVIKAMFIDIAQLQQLYRIIVFFVLGTLLLLVAWGYHKAFHSRESSS